VLIVAGLTGRHQGADGAALGAVDMAEQLLGPGPAAGVVVHHRLPGIEAGGVGPGHADELERLVAQGRQGRDLIRHAGAARHLAQHQGQAGRGFFAIALAQAIELQADVVAAVAGPLGAQGHRAVDRRRGHRQVHRRVDLQRQSAGRLSGSGATDDRRLHPHPANVQIEQAGGAGATGELQLGLGHAALGAVQRQAPDLAHRVGLAPGFVHRGEHRTLPADALGQGHAGHQHQLAEVVAGLVVIDLGDDQTAHGRRRAIGRRVVHLGVEQRNTDVRRDIAETDRHYLAP